jgi:hypothetical protein
MPKQPEESDSGLELNGPKRQLRLKGKALDQFLSYIGPYLPLIVKAVAFSIAAIGLAFAISLLEPVIKG